MTTATPIAAGTILAIDLGRYKSVACAYDRASRAAPTSSACSNATPAPWWWSRPAQTPAGPLTSPLPTAWR